MQDDDLTRHWELALSGDRNSFEWVIDATYTLMFQYGCKFSRDRETVKDAIQDICLEIFEKRATISRHIPAKAYLLASLRRRIHRLGERQRLMVFSDDPLDHIDFRAEMGFEHDMIQAESARQLAAELAAMINKLPPRQQEAIYLRFFKDMDREDIAFLMDIQPQSVSNLMQEALRWMRVQWKPAMLLLPLAFATLKLLEKKF